MNPEDDLGTYVLRLFLYFMGLGIIGAFVWLAMRVSEALNLPDVLGMSIMGLGAITGYLLVRVFLRRQFQTSMPELLGCTGPTPWVQITGWVKRLCNRSVNPSTLGETEVSAEKKNTATVSADPPSTRRARRLNPSIVTMPALLAGGFLIGWIAHRPSGPRFDYLGNGAVRVERGTGRTEQFESRGWTAIAQEVPLSELKALAGTASRLTQEKVEPGVFTARRRKRGYTDEEMMGGTAVAAPPRKQRYLTTEEAMGQPAPAPVVNTTPVGQLKPFKWEPLLPERVEYGTIAVDFHNGSGWTMEAISIRLTTKSGENEFTSLVVCSQHRGSGLPSARTRFVGTVPPWQNFIREEGDEWKWEFESATGTPPSGNP